MAYADLEHGRAMRREQARHRRETKPELVREQRRASAARRRTIDPFRGKTREAFLADCRRYRATRRARQRDAFVEVVDPLVVWDEHEGLCGVCDAAIEGPFHVDHIQPLAKGGLHCYSNVQPAHPTCNLRKNDAWPAAA